MERVARFFDFEGKKTGFAQEFRGGLTTFLAMVYILAVNPSILSATGMPADAVFVATALSAAVATILMGIYAKLPFALASGMGLNAYFAYTVCLGMGYPWQMALTAVLVEGLVFIVLSYLGVREAIFRAIPSDLRKAVSIGIGLFIALIGLINAGIIQADPATAVAHFNFQSADFHVAGIQVLLAIVGIIITGILVIKKVPGNLLLGILITWVIGMVCQVIGIYVPNPEVGAYSLFPSFSNMASISAVSQTAFKFDFSYLLTPTFWFVVFAFLFVDIFDTLGTLTGCAIEGKMLDENGDLPRMKEALATDAIGTIFGACTGTSTVTTFVESSAGIAAGAKTGFASVVTGVLFALSLFLSPIFLAIPSFATTPALVMVGFLMMRGSAKEIEWEDYTKAIPAFATIIMMPFAYSIATGIAYGFVTYTLLNLIVGEYHFEKGGINYARNSRNKINIGLVVISILFIIKFAVFGN